MVGSGTHSFVGNAGTRPRSLCTKPKKNEDEISYLSGKEGWPQNNGKKGLKTLIETSFRYFGDRCLLSARLSDTFKFRHK